VASEFFLSRAEVRALTGRTYAAWQRRVLEEKKIPFEPDADGWPQVLRASVERRILGRANSPEPAGAPDFSAFPAV